MRSTLIKGLMLGCLAALLCASAVQAEDITATAAKGDQVAAASQSKTEVYTDPYRRYFSGHWCNCWRKVNMNPIDEEAVFAGILPRSDSPMWMKHKLINMEGMDADEKLLCRAFAGLVNRSKAQWYCQDGDDFWLQGSRAYYKDGITGLPIRAVWARGGGGQQIGYRVAKEGKTNYMVGIKRFVLELDPPSIDGCIIYDPELLDPNAKPKQPRDVLNVVRTMCAIERALPLTPRLYDELVQQLGSPDKLPVIMDTTKRADWNLDKFHGDERAAAYSIYAWAFNNFWENKQNEKRQCVHHALCYMPPLGPTDPEQDITDYVVQWKIFCFYSHGGENLDEKHMEYVLTQTPMNIPVIGQLTDKAGEEAGNESMRMLRLFSRFGKYFVDLREAGNLSIHSGERPTEREQQKQKTATEVALEPNKRYVAFCVTGANSVGHFMGDRAYHWDYATRGSVSVGWTMPLAAADVVPNITKFYYNSMSENDCFVADVGGLGIALPTVWGSGTKEPERLLNEYYARSAEYMGYLDLSTAWAGWLDEKRIDDMAKNLNGLKGVFYGSAGASDYLDRSTFMQGELPVMHTYVTVARKAEDFDKIAQTLKDSKERFCFIGVDERGFTKDDDVIGMIAKAAGELGDGIAVVRPDQFATLYAQAVKANQVPAAPPKVLATINDKGLEIKRVADGAVKIDGKDNEWAGLKPMVAYVTKAGELVSEKPADADLAAEVAAAVDGKYLYIKAQVLDKEVVVDDANLTAGDHLELLIDTRSDPFREPRMTEGFYRLALVPAAGLVKKPDLVLKYPTYDVGLVSMNKHGIQHELSSVTGNGGYMIEASIPLANFPHAEWKQGDRVALGFAVRDFGQTQMARVNPLICRPAVVD